MGNHNIEITNSNGRKQYQFVEAVTRTECIAWMKEYGPAPSGWDYKIVNVKKRERPRPDHVLITGYGWKDDAFEKVDERKARIKLNNGSWYTPKKAKKHMRAMGAVYFEKKKVWNNEA